MLHARHRPAATTAAVVLTLALAGCRGCGEAGQGKAGSRYQKLDGGLDGGSEPGGDGEARKKAGRPPIIDVHTHIGPNAYALAFRIADENGVSRLVNLSGGHADRAMDQHLGALDAFPGRLALFYNLDWGEVNAPDFGPRMAEGLEVAVRRGYAGLKIPKVLGLGATDEAGAFIPVDDPRFDPIWRKAGELGVPVAIHTGDPRAFFEPIGPDNERFEELSAAPGWSFADPKYPRRAELLAQRNRMIARHPGTTFILVHMANNPEDLDDVERVLKAHPNAVVDISARIAEIGRHDPERVRRLFVDHKDRILFGTDLGVHVKRRGDAVYYSLFLGSISKEPPTLDDVGTFYARHFAFLEKDAAEVGPIRHPVPIQGDWTVRPIHLPDDVLKAVYHDNAFRIVFAPMLERREGGQATPGPPPGGQRP